MEEGVLAAVLSLVGSLIGTLGGVLAAARLTNYRISQLEKRMEEMGELVKRIYQLEQRSAVQEERLKTAGFGLAQSRVPGPN